MNFKQGELIGGRYEVIALLGYGANGPTYLVRPNVGALCVLHTLDDLYDVESEATLIRRAPYETPNHRNVTVVLDSWIEPYRGYGFGGESRSACIVREAVDGRSLARVSTKKHGLPPRDVAYRIVADAARGLAAIHALGHVARLTGPDKIFVAQSGVTQIKMLASDQLTRQASSSTGGRLRPSLLTYFGQEGMRGEAWTKSVDVYALGVMLWELTIGPRADVSSTLDFISAIFAWSAGAAMPAGVSDDLAALLLSTLHDDPTERPTASEVAEQLDRLGGHDDLGANTPSKVASWLASLPGREADPYCKGIDSAQTTLRPIDPVEHEFLASLEASTGDDEDLRAVREVYSDWLEERGDWIKAAYLRLVLAPAWKRSNGERRALEIDLDPYWCRAVRGSECLLEYESECEFPFEAQGSEPEPPTLRPDPPHDRPTLRVLDPMWWMPQT